MEQDFKVGDIVVLKEYNYLKMVVRNVVDNDKIICNWFNGNLISEYTFYSDQLKKFKGE